MSANNGYATKDDFFARTKRRFKDVPLWDGKKGRIRSLNEQEFSDLDSKNLDFKRGGLSAAGVKASNVRLVIACVCDGEGNQVFSDTDAAMLATVDAAVIEPLVREIREHCGLRQDSEDIAKNSVAGEGGASPCSSPAPSHTP